jgi:ribose transport system substrate-binding protein
VTKLKRFGVALAAVDHLEGYWMNTHCARSLRLALERLRLVALAGGTLLGATSLAQAADTMVGGEFALKGEVTLTVGPNGATGQPASVLTFTDEEIKRLQAGHYSVALLFQTSSDWANAVTLGAQDELKALGIEVAGLSNSNYSASDQAHAVQTILAKKPSGIVVWPVNPDELRPALQKAADAGVKLALISNMPSGFQQGKDYVGLVGDDLFAMGQKTAQGLAKAIGQEGEIGFLYFDANAYVVNQRDAAFRTTIEKEFPKIKIAATQGFSDPQRAFQIASAMILQNPKLKAIYAPWAEPAAGVLQAIRAAHRTDIAVGTMDLSNTVAVSLVQGGAVKALTVDDPYSIGKSLVAEIGYSLIGKTAPAYVQVPAIPVTKGSILEAYAQSYHAAPPPEVTQALGK